MQFDVVATNPPFQDSTNRKKTQHKLWINFTKQAFDKWLKPDGLLLQVSPSSFLSPSSKVLKIFQEKIIEFLRLDIGDHFPDVNSTFAYYSVVNSDTKGEYTTIVNEKGVFTKRIDNNIFYLPNDFCAESLSIHKKVIFNYTDKLDVKYDYVTCHNVLIHRNDTISKTPTEKHIHPIYHTNKQIWYSQVRQDWADERKVMWTRSGYTKPFYDDGRYGGTDMIYYLIVNNANEGLNLLHNLESKLMKYILETAKWSGFGNEKVFKALPNLPRDKELTDDEVYQLFGLTEPEIEYVGKD